MYVYKTDTLRSGIWSRAILLGLLSWIVLTCGALFCAAHTVRVLPAGRSLAIGIGPLGLVHVVKAASVGGGFVLSVAFQRGFFVLGILCCVAQIGIAVGVPAFLHHANRRRLVQVRKK